jgi:hypothetical protein
MMVSLVMDRKIIIHVVENIIAHRLVDNPYFYLNEVSCSYFFGYIKSCFVSVTSEHEYEIKKTSCSH